jgi:hypothetical protein
MSLAKELAKLKAALDAPWPEEIWKAKAEIAERELSATKDEYCKTAFALTEYTGRAEKAEAEVARLKEELQLVRLATAPEEPVIKESLTTEPAPEWRELGPDEVIQMDDMYRNDVSSRNYPVTSVMIGKPAGNFPFPEYSFRTRRPLPKQEEDKQCSVCVPDEQCWECAPSVYEQELPLEKIANTPEPAPEWRELGPDEVIQEGDNLFYEPNGKCWEECDEIYSGLKAGKMTNYHFRTRRPLPDPVPTQPPTQNGWRELGHDEDVQEGDEYTDPDDCWWPVSSSTVGFPASRFNGVGFRTRRPLPKREMPLEKELTAIEDGNPWIDPSKNILICIRYLRDEIEQLKKNQK